MGKNIKNDPRETLFIDLDGTIVKHNYDPENIEDELLPNTISYLKNFKGHKVLTTSRIAEHCDWILIRLARLDIVFDDIICNLPTGKRILINDYTGDGKADAINVGRDQGVN